MKHNKAMRRIQAVVFCLILLVVGMPTIAATAATEVTNTLDFSTMPTQDNAGSSVQLIKAAGAVDAVNLYVAGNHTPVANPGGYMGEGYYIQKLDAGAGKAFEKVYLDLNYWVGTADPQGYLKVYVSTDNLNYTEIFAQTEGNGDPWVETTQQEVTLTLEQAVGVPTVYVKVVMQHWTTWEGAAVKTSVLRGLVEQNETVSPPPVVPDDLPSIPITATFDFSAMATDVVKNEVRQDLMGYGLYDCGNVQVGGNYGNVATPGGYAGEGYVVHKLSAPKGQTFLSAQLDLRYWAYNVGGNKPGYVQILASADGLTYTELAKVEGSSDKSSVQTYRAELPMAVGAAAVYVKVVMQHWESYEGAAVKKITINGKIPAGVNENEGNGESEDEGNGEDTDEGEGTVTAQHKVEVHQDFSDLAFGEVTAEQIGATGESNLYFGIDGVALLTPRGGYETAYGVWKVSAIKGETLEDAVFCFVGRTWYITVDQKENNALKILVSTDGSDFTEAECYRSNENADDTQVFQVDLTEYVAGSSQVYVKMEWLLFDSPHIMGIRSVTLTGNTRGKVGAGDEGAQEDPPTPDDETSGDDGDTEQDDQDPTLDQPTKWPSTTIMWIAVGVAAVIAGGVAAICLVRRKRSRSDQKNDE